MKITVSAQVLSGNLGDGWADQNEAAQGFAGFLTQKLEARIQEQHPDAEIEIDIDVQENTSGCSRELSVSVDPWDDEMGFEIETKLCESLLYTESSAWDEFCGGAGSEYFDEAV